MTPSASTRDRIVVTGAGAVSAYGVGVDSLIDGLRSGRTGIGPLDVFDASEHRTSIAGQIPSGALDAADAHGAGRRERSTRTDRMALLAAAEAIEQSGIAIDAAPGGVGIFFGSSSGGIFEGETWYQRLAAGQDVSQRMLASHLFDCAASAIARRYGVRGPVVGAASACVAGSMSIHAAAASLRSGEVDAALAGGADGLCQLTYAGFNALRAMDESPSRPFQAERLGLSLGEGAGILVLERLEDALARGAAVLGELVASAETCDATHMTAPHPEGRGAQEAVRRVMRDAGLDAGDIAFVNAHGTGTPLNDKAESAALRSVFGDALDMVPVTSTKGGIGHLLGACGPVEVIVMLRDLADGVVHPTPGAETVDPECNVDLVIGTPRAIDRTKVALSTNLAFGGANTAIAVRLVEDPR